MSGPHGGEEPPSILIAWSSKHGAWTATSVWPVNEDGTIEGPSTSTGLSPADALQALLTRHYCALVLGECPATAVTLKSEEAR